MSNGIYGRESTILNNKIILLANDGLTTQQIADEVGITKGSVGSRISKLIAAGKLKRRSERTGSVDTPKGRYFILRGRYNRKSGSIMDLLLQLPMEQAEWLYKTAPKDTNIAQWCAVLLRDVIAEEMEK